MAEFTSEPLVWETHDMRLTVDRSNGKSKLEFLREHTAEEMAIAVLVPQKMADRNKFIPLNEAGFQWVASEIRLALSEARLAELEAVKQRVTTALRIEDEVDEHSLDFIVGCIEATMNQIAPHPGFKMMGESRVNRELARLRGEVTELKGELKTSRMDAINLRIERDEEKRQAENAEALLQAQVKLRESDFARVVELEADVQKEKDNAGDGEAERSRLRKYNAEYRERMAKLEASMTFDLGDGMNTVSIVGDPNLPRLIAVAWPSHVVGRPVLERAVEMIEGHPKLERKVFELKAELAEWRCTSAEGRCRGCPDCQPIGGTRAKTLKRNRADDRKDGGP